MHYYKRNIGEYHKKAGRLSMLQHGAYTLLIDACYDREIFPTKEEAIDWCWATTEEEIAAVELVLRKFFVEIDGLYEQRHIREDLDKYHENAKINKRIAIEREEKRRTKRERSVNEAPPNHKPLTNNHHKVKYTEDDLSVGEWIYSKLLLLNPRQKPPDFNKWAETIRIMRERDKVTHDEIKKLFTWANNDNFWQKNILSPAKLRGQWDTLIIASGQNKKPFAQTKYNDRTSL